MTKGALRVNNIFKYATSELSQDATTTLALYDYSSNPTKKDGEYYRIQSNFFRENTMNSSHAKYFKNT